MRGLRNNNPLNIRRSADRWQGERMEQTDKAFVQFTSLPYGYRAAWKVLDSYWSHFRKEAKAYNVRNIIARWAPPNENDTEAYIRHVISLSGMGGNENLVRPANGRNLERMALLIGAMTCIENGIAMDKVDKEAIWKGYDLAWPRRRGCCKEEGENSEDCDEYWEWSPMAYGK